MIESEYHEYTLNKLKYVLLMLVVAMAFELGYIEFFLSAIPSKAQCTDISTNARYSNGLLTYPTAAPDPNNRFGGNLNGTQPGPCVISQNAAQLATFQIPSYEELKRNYFEQISPSYLNAHNHIDKLINPNNSCPTGLPTANDAQISFNGNKDRLINLTTAPTSTTNCELTMVQSPVLNPETNMVVFVDGDMIVNGDLLYPNHVLATTPPQTAGIIYVVRGDVLISSNVSEIDGVILAGGTIYSSCQGNTQATCITDQTATTKQLVINGDLINLDATQPIQFKRDLTLVNGNSTPAEKVVADPKFLVLFHQLFAQTFSVQSEDTNFAVR